MACVLLHNSGYSSVFLGAAAGDTSATLSCFKVYNKDYPLQPRHWLNISRECCILSRLQEDRVDGIVQLLSVADTANHFSLQFKPCLGGNLYQCLERRECCEEQELCAKVIIPLLRVLDSLHSRGIIHRDIKPENIFFEEDGKLVLGDFGLAIDCNKDRPCSRVGTQDYMAPEVLSQPSADTVALRNIPAHMLQPYTTAVDIWALGTLIHEALTGKVPFYHHEPTLMALKAQFSPPARLPSSISTECQAFVDAVLQKQPGKRPTAAELLQHPWVQKHAAAASSLVAARLKAKFLAELRLPASTSTSSAKSSPVAPTKVSRGCRSTASLHVARDLHNSPAATAVASGLRGSCCTAASNPAAARVNFDFGTSSKGSTSSSCSGNDAAMDGADSVCTVSSSGSRSGHTSNRAAAPSAGSQEDSQAQQQAAPKPTAVRPCGCKSLGVSFDCGSLSKGQEHQPLGTSPCAAALKAAAATAGANQNVRLPRPQQQQQRATAPGMSQCDQDCSATTAANASSTPHSGVLPQQLQLSPALSEPMLVDVHTPFEHPASKSQVDNSSGSCCCCTGGQRSSQSGTCSTAAAAAAAAANAHPLAWPLGVPVAAAAGFSQQQREQARHGTQGACAQGLAVPAGAHSAPANTGDLQALLATGHQPRSLGTLAAPSGARRVVQLGRATSTAAAASSSSGTKGVAAAAVTKAPGPQKPPLLKSSSIAVPPGQAVAAATSPKPLLPSPPKPALLLQRLRSLGHAHKEPSSAGGFPAWNRRHSVDLAAGNPGATAAVSSAPSGSSDPAVVTDPQPGAAAAAAALPDLVTPPRSKARPPAAAGMASPLAALCRLGGLLTNPTAAGSAATVAAAKRHNSCCSETSRDRSCDPGSLVQAGSSAAQRSSPGAAAGAAGLLVGLAGCEAGVVSDGAGYMRDAVPCGQTSPPQPCRSAKGVCMKMLGHVLKHHQQA